MHWPLVHAAGLGLIALSVMLLLAPAALHRLAFNGEDAAEVHSVGSRLVAAASATLALGLGAAVMVALGALSGRMDYAAFIAIAMVLFLVALWYIWPLAIRARLQRKG